jgi:hypothetical protein
MATLRTALEGHDLSLGWNDFQAAVPANRAQGEAAFAEARFDLAYDYDYDTENATEGYRVNHVLVRVTLHRDLMWAVASARTADLLRHEQGHYDIVALLARDLYNELTGWNSAKPPKRFRKDADLKRAVERWRRGTKSLVAHVGGAGENVGVYDKQTNHGQDAKAQGGWDKSFADARMNGTRLMAALGGLGVGAPP